MNEDNPLIQALKNRAGPKETVSNSDDLLQYILAHFDLVPKEQEQESEPDTQNVVTQESHVP